MLKAMENCVSLLQFGKRRNLFLTCIKCNFEILKQQLYIECSECCSVTHVTCVQNSKYQELKNYLRSYQSESNNIEFICHLNHQYRTLRKIIITQYAVFNECDEVLYKRQLEVLSLHHSYEEVMSRVRNIAINFIEDSKNLQCSFIRGEFFVQSQMYHSDTQETMLMHYQDLIAQDDRIIMEHSNVVRRIMDFESQFDGKIAILLAKIQSYLNVSFTLGSTIGFSLKKIGSNKIYKSIPRMSLRPHKIQCNKFTDKPTNFHRSRIKKESINFSSQFGNKCIHLTSVPNNKSISFKFKIPLSSSYRSNHINLHHHSGIKKHYANYSSNVPTMFYRSGIKFRSCKLYHRSRIKSRKSNFKSESWPNKSHEILTKQHHSNNRIIRFYHRTRNKNYNHLNWINCHTGKKSAKFSSDSNAKYVYYKTLNRRNANKKHRNKKYHRNRIKRIKSKILSCNH